MMGGDEAGVLKSFSHAARHREDMVYQSPPKMCGQQYWLWIVFIYVCLPGLEGVYFPQEVYQGIVQPSDEAGQALVKLYALRNSTSPGDLVTEFQIVAISGGKDDANYSNAFGVNSSGWVYLKDPDVFLKSQGNKVTLHVEASEGEETPPARVPIQLTFKDPDQDPCAQACFLEALDVLHVEENSADRLFIGRLGVNLRHMACENVDISYQVTSFHVQSLNANMEPKKWVYVNNRTSEVVLLSSLDREAWSEAAINLLCLVNHRNGSTESRQKTLTLMVSDVDDSPPVLQNQKSTTQRTRKEWNFLKSKQLKLLISDNDTAGTYDYRILLRRNESRWFRVSKTKPFKIKSGGKWNRTIWTAEIRLVNDKKPPGVVNANFEVVFQDKLYQQPEGSQLSGEVVVEVSVKLAEQETAALVVHDQHTAQVSRQAARFSQVLNLAKEMGFKETKGMFFYMGRSKSQMFRVTSKTGIVYVHDTNALLTSGSSLINVTVQLFRNSSSKTVMVTVTLTTDHLHQPLPCEDTCSSYSTEAKCEKSCGIGAVNGRCVMRPEPMSGHQTALYGTCSPNLATCPDSVCDELEKDNILLCPQDCTQDDIVGVSSKDPDRKDSVGIHLARGTCWCNSRARCQCWSSSTFITTPRLTPTEDPNTDGMTSTALIEEPLPIGQEPSSPGYNGVTEASGVSKEGLEVSPSLCGTVCKTIAGLVVVAIGIVSGIAFSAWCVQRRRKRRTDKLRHVGSNVSMNAIPSDYVEERRTSHNSIEWSPKIINTQNGYDKKWEFPRKNLILGKNLGEGEFGQVVKAKAYHLHPNEEYSHVAVKMLKNCSNETEYQDLLSEFNLLKDVSHPNVIKLLGACTKEEPLYIIVEYCEHGSLRHYLRACRHQNALYMESQEWPPGQPKEPVQWNLSTRDLLSFAWQIAKGMHYLAEMKVVHRDLAARNVLVSAGRVVKISDFGLSRDVYEADAYMKKSKGRIPVKWMAPESLYDQVYTIKSDVWSYGIVLWEIVTLGATPYPGIPPERLFGLLKTGYRMDRPENCSDELYAVMQKCWKAEPLRRPYFVDLVNIFDSMLQAKMEYLDLNGAFRAPFELDYDVSLDGLTSGSPARPNKLQGNEQAYGNISVVKTDSSLYLTPTSKTEQLVNRENSSRGKTFPKNDSLLQVGYHPSKRRTKVDYELEVDDEVFEAKETDSLRCSKV